MSPPVTRQPLAEVVVYRRGLNVESVEWHSSDGKIQLDLTDLIVGAVHARIEQSEIPTVSLELRACLVERQLP